MTDPTAPPLAGIRVLDFTRILAGPYCTMVLADMGADVIKVEHPDGGDDTRHWGPPFVGDDAAYFLAVNRRKRSVALDLKDATDRDLAVRLAGEADVVIANFRPGVMEGYGLGFDDLADAGIVHCSITAFGPGPREDDPGYDIVIQALTGFMSMTGSPSGEPAKMGVALLDVIAGLHAAVAVLGGLEARRRTGQAQRITVPLFDAGLAALANQAANHLLGGVVPRAMGTAHPNIAPYQAFAAADGWVIIAAANDRLFARLCGVLDRPDLAADGRYGDNAARVANRESLAAAIGATIAGAGVDEWVERLTAARVPAAPVRDLAAVFTAPEAQPMVAEIDDPVRGTLRLVGDPVDGFRVAPMTPPPLLGEHTDDVRACLWDRLS